MPTTAHRGYPDPWSPPDSGKKVAFALTRQAIGCRMRQLPQLPLDNLSNAELQSALTAVSDS